MALTIFSIMVVLLLLGFPMMIPLIVGAFVGFYSLFGGFGQLETMVQQMMAGVRPASLIAVPMFIFAADIMTRGQSAGRLICATAQMRALFEIVLKRGWAAAAGRIPSSMQRGRGGMGERTLALTKMIRHRMWRQCPDSS